MAAKHARADNLAQHVTTLEARLSECSPRGATSEVQPVNSEVVGVQPGAGPGAAQEPLVALQATLTVRLTLAPLHPTTG